MGVYLLIIRYGDEAERKRVEYVLERFRDELRMRKPSGTVWILDAPPSRLERLLEELLARVSREKVELYRLEEAGVEVKERRTTLRVSTSLRDTEVWGAIGYVIAQLKGALVSEYSGVREYVVRPRGGYARIRVSVSPRGSGSLVFVEVSGYGGGFDRLVASLFNHLKLLGDVSRVE